MVKQYPWLNEYNVLHLNFMLDVITIFFVTKVTYNYYKSNL